MIARVALDLILRKEFDYYIPPPMEGVVGVGSRVKVPFGSRFFQKGSHRSRSFRLKQRDDLPLAFA